jgi:hypothetical protein
VNEVWEKLGDYERKPFLALVQAIADYQVDAKAHGGKPAELTVIASKLTSAPESFDFTLTIHFFFSKWQYCFAQSGSDWGEHHHWLGTATFVGRRLASVTLDHTLVTLMETSCDDYDVAAGAAAAREQAIAKLAAQRG